MGPLTGAFQDANPPGNSSSCSDLAVPRVHLLHIRQTARVTSNTAVNVARKTLLPWSQSQEEKMNVEGVLSAESAIVTEPRSGCSLLKSQFSRDECWQERTGCFIFETGHRRGRRTPVQRPTPPLTIRGKSFYRQGRGLHAETIQSALTVILKLVIGGLTSVISIVLGTVNLQFYCRFVSISLRPILGIVAAYVMATAWSSCR